MTKAALYARVSSDAQQKEGTIESQVAELKRQIAAADHVLVKEYIDDGVPGPLLDRPALNQLRADAKADVCTGLLPRRRPYRERGCIPDDHRRGTAQVRQADHHQGTKLRRQS